MVSAFSFQDELLREAHGSSGFRDFSGRVMWLWVKTHGMPFWLVGDFTSHFRNDFSGWIESDVHWGCDLVLTHGHVCSLSHQCFRKGEQCFNAKFPRINKFQWLCCQRFDLSVGFESFRGDVYTSRLPIESFRWEVSFWGLEINVEPQVAPLGVSFGVYSQTQEALWAP